MSYTDSYIDHLAATVSRLQDRVDEHVVTHDLLYRHLNSLDRHLHKISEQLADALTRIGQADDDPVK